MPAVSSDRFLDALRKSGLLAAELLDAQLRRSAAEGPPEDARELAARFVRDGLLTSFQADQLLQGKWRGFVIAGKYRVLGVLGAGGMGQVYLAEHTLMRRRSALKVLPTKLTEDPAAVERFVREAQAVAALDHPNIVRAYDIDKDEEIYFLVMEYVEGISLQDLVGRLGPLGPAAAANYVAQAARGLQHAHEAGWVHRDIKPANLLLDRAGVVKVLDLGLARLLGDDATPITAKIDDNSVFGTADYLAPEQAIDSHSVDIRADIYSLGATFYFLLTAKPPFGEGTIAQKLLAHQTRPPRPIHEARADVPATMVEVLERMMAKLPADRYPAPAAIADALAAWAGGGTAYPPPMDLIPSSSAGSTSAAMLSWAPRSGSKSTAGPKSGRKGYGDTAPVAAWSDTTERISPSKSKLSAGAPAPPRRRSAVPILIGAAGAILLVTVGTVGLWWSNRPNDAGGDRKPESLVAAPAVTAQEVQRFVGHEGVVENVAFSRDGKLLITTGQDKTARIWDVATGRELRRLVGHTSTVRGLVVLPDGNRVVTTGLDRTVRLWDLDTRAELKRYHGHTVGVWAVSCDETGKRLLTAESDKTIRLWNTDTAKELKRLTGHEDRVTGVVFLPGGRRAVSASQDRTVRLWDVDAGKELRKIALSDKIGHLTLSADGRWALFGCGKTLRRWDPDGAMQTTQVSGPSNVQGGVTLPDGRMLIAMLDGTVRLWDINRDKELQSLPVGDSAVMALAVAPDGKHFAAVGKDGLARLWRVP